MTKRSDRDLVADDAPTATGSEEWVQAAQRHYDPDDVVELTTTIVYAIADAKDVAATELTVPLYEAVDVAGIQETFFGPTAESEPRPGVGRVEFRYDDCLVTVASDGWVQVYESVESTD